MHQVGKKDCYKIVVECLQGPYLAQAVSLRFLLAEARVW